MSRKIVSVTVTFTVAVVCDDDARNLTDEQQTHVLDVCYPTPEGFDAQDVEIDVRVLTVKP